MTRHFGKRPGRDRTLNTSEPHSRLMQEIRIVNTFDRKARVVVPVTFVVSTVVVVVVVVVVAVVADAIAAVATSFPGLFPFELGRPTQFKREKPWERGCCCGCCCCCFCLLLLLLLLMMMILVK